MRVSDVLDLLAHGASQEEILRDYEWLDADDIYACIEYAARFVDAETHWDRLLDEAHLSGPPIAVTDTFWVRKRERLRLRSLSRGAEGTF